MAEGDSMGQRAIRALRGTIAAAVSTLIAAVSHSIADGQLPSVFAVSVALTASVFVCIVLAGKSLSRPRLALAVVLSQLAYHGMFAFAPPGGSVSAPAGALGAHAQHALGSIDVQAGALAHDHGTTMWIAHVLAAVVTVLALATGEQVVRELFATLRLALSTFFEAPAPVPIPRLAALFPDAVAPRRAPVIVSSRSQRGPPVLALG